MAKGQKRSVEERLNEIVQKRTERKDRFDKTDAADATAERALREELVRAEVTARHLASLDAEVAAELAKLDAPANGVETGDQDLTDAVYA